MTLSGVEDRVVDGPQPYTVELDIISNDARYAELAVGPLSVTNQDSN